MALTLFETGGEAEWLRSFRFFVEIKPRYCECDGQGHVSNVVYAEYLELSRLQYFKAANDPEPGALFAFQHVTAELHLRYIAACFYDEPLRAYSKLAHVGKSSATMEQAIVGADDLLRIVSRVAIVRSDGHRTMPWSTEQRIALERVEGRPFTSSVAFS